MIVASAYRPINGAPEIKSGSKPDGGNYIFTQDERDRLLLVEPGAETLLRDYIGAEELLNGNPRYILALQDVPPSILRSLPQVLQRIELVKQYREASKSISTSELAKTPLQYHVTVLPDKPYLALPQVSSSRREYKPIAFLEPPIVPSNLLYVFEYATTYHFAILTSAMHMSWLREIGGRLKSDYRYSIGIVYNTFPWPSVTDRQRERKARFGQAVLEAREAHPECTLADLYDPLAMPTSLRKAHTALDIAVDRLYKNSGFDSDRSRVEHLLGMYEQLTASLFAVKRSRRGLAMDRSK